MLTRTRPHQAPFSTSNHPADHADFRTILFPAGLDQERREQTEQPACFVDLNLDQVVSNIVAGRNEAVLRPLFYSTYRNEQIIHHRQAVFRDLDRPDVFCLFPPFCDDMKRVRGDLDYAGKIRTGFHQNLVTFRATALYCRTITNLLHQLQLLELRSHGLQDLRKYLAGYASSERFTAFMSETNDVQAVLSAINYETLFRGDRLTVRRYASEPDYTVTVLDRFSRFRETDIELPTQKPPKAEYGLNHIEEAILEFVGRLFPDQSSALERYVVRHEKFIDETVSLFEQEIGFFIAYLSFIAPLRASGLPFCYPDVSASGKETDVSQSFDIALASKLLEQSTPIVCNDFHLTGAERMLVVSGPNQGGKTTFARMFGQLHFLAGLGCPVPGQRGRLFLPDLLFTHFEREEDITNLRGKLEDELIRLRESCQAMTSDSVIVLNEIFNSTSLDDQIFLSTKMLEKILATDALGACVTFIDALATLSEKTVSMVSTVVPEDPACRTFKIVRRRADGLAYALSLAEKHGVTYERLRNRIRT